MSVFVREFRRSDREQLTNLVNLHVSSVLPGVALSTNVVLNQLEREPGEQIVDPWIEERHCLVAVEHDAVVGAALLHRFSHDDRVRDGYRSAVEIRWLIFVPSATTAGNTLLASAIEKARDWHPTRIYADGSLPAPGVYGIPDSWPHVRQLLLNGGFAGPIRTELVLAAPCNQLTGHQLDGADVSRTVGTLGARLDLIKNGESLGFIEVGEIHPGLSRSTASVNWTDVGNLFATDPKMLPSVMPALISAAAEWLLLGGVERLIDYYADDVHQPHYLLTLQDLGFTRLATNERGWELLP